MTAEPTREQIANLIVSIHNPVMGRYDRMAEPGKWLRIADAIQALYATLGQELQETRETLSSVRAYSLTQAKEILALGQEVERLREEVARLNRVIDEVSVWMPEP